MKNLIRRLLLSILQLCLGAAHASQAIPGVINSEAPAKPPQRVEGTVLAGTPAGFAANVEVRFWRQGNASQAQSTTTDNSGRYSLSLDNGSWQGSACGSERGFQPLFWEVEVIDGEVVSLNENNTRSPRIDSIEPAILRSGEEVTINGQGFGCSGQVELSVPSMDVLVVSDFIEHRDNRLRFVVPDIPSFPTPEFLIALALLGCNGNEECIADIPARLDWGDGVMKFRHSDLQSAPAGFDYNNTELDE